MAFQKVDSDKAGTTFADTLDRDRTWRLVTSRNSTKLDGVTVDHTRFESIINFPTMVTVGDRTVESMNSVRLRVSGPDLTRGERIAVLEDLKVHIDALVASPEVLEGFTLPAAPLATNYSAYITS